MPGAPYLARFSRDVGYHCSFPLTLDSSDALSGQHRWYPTSREKRARCGAPGLGEGTRVIPLNSLREKQLKLAGTTSQRILVGRSTREVKTCIFQRSIHSTLTL